MVLRCPAMTQVSTGIKKKGKGGRKKKETCSMVLRCPTITEVRAELLRIHRNMV